MLVYGGVCREDFEPATACDVAASMARAGQELPESVVIHDVANACLGVMTGIVDVANRIELGQIRAGLVVSAETARDINDVAIAQLNADPTPERFARSVATFTGGSGAVAVLLTDGSFGESERRRLLGGAIHSAPRHHRLCRWGIEAVDANDPDPLRPLRPYARTDAGAVLENGVALGERTWASFLQQLQWTRSDIDRTVCHQIGAVHRKTMLGRLGVPLERDFSTVEHLGNTGTVALPMATALAHQRGFLEAGHRVALLGIGSGLSCMMLGVQW
jgi:3-oxoacyl-[acyl-carrier-protein] synthase-3